MSEKLGIAQQGYPNVAVYDADHEYIGRVLGFGGTAPWFRDVMDAVEVGETLTAAKAKAEEKPEEWIGVAEVLVGIPDRAEDALAALDNVPKRTQSSKAFKKAKARIEAKAGWGELDKELGTLMRGVRTKEAAAMKAPEALEKLDAFLKDHEGADPDVDPAALSKKGFFHVILDETEAAMKIAKRLLEEFPESDQAKGLLRGMR